jgi:glyoxylase-like metal-dependent hydrolase (beta-lactamase superfamily II)
MAFPNATIYLSSAERRHWLGNDPLQPGRLDLTELAAPSKAALKPYLDAGKVKSFGNGSTLFEGVEARVVPGHTPGHTIYNITSGHAKMSFIGDLVHAREIQFARPEVAFAYDNDFQAAASQRRRMFEALSQSGVAVATAHMDFPGIGHIRAQGRSFEWVGTPYSLAKLK